MGDCPGTTRQVYLPARAPTVSMVLKRTPAWDGARSRGFKNEPPTDNPWKANAIDMATKLPGKSPRPDNITMATVRRNTAEPPRETEVKAHLVALRLTGKKVGKLNDIIVEMASGRD